MRALAPGETRERNLSWRLDATVIDLSRDGRTLLFSEVFFLGGRTFGTSIRRTDGSPAVRLGEGFGAALSPDGRWALAFTGSGPSLEFVLLPTGAGEPKRFAQGLPRQYHGAGWLPDSRSFVFSGSSPGEGARLYRQQVDGGAPQPLTDADLDLTLPVVSPDARSVAAIDAYGSLVVAPIGGGDVRSVPGVEDEELPLQWRTDGRALYVYRSTRLPVQVFEVDLESGGRRRVLEIVVHDPTGQDGNVTVALTPDARGYAYSFYRHLEELLLIEGLQ
jgi:Tol biopolymer transport system component